jgi:hypothetical protein
MFRVFASGAMVRSDPGQMLTHHRTIGLKPIRSVPFWRKASGLDEELRVFLVEKPQDQIDRQLRIGLIQGMCRQRAATDHAP